MAKEFKVWIHVEELNTTTGKYRDDDLPMQAGYFKGRHADKAAYKLQVALSTIGKARLKLHIITSSWRGLLEEPEAFMDHGKAEKRFKAVQKKLGIKPDDPELSENAATLMTVKVK